MIWTMVMEKVQITFPWKSPSLSLSRLPACAAVGGVSVEVMEQQLKSTVKQHFLYVTPFL